MKRFISAIWDDICPDWRALLAGVVVGCIVMIPITGLGRILSEIMNKPFDESIGASAGLLFFLLIICLFISYLRQKWRESR